MTTEGRPATKEADTLALAGGVLLVASSVAAGASGCGGTVAGAAGAVESSAVQREAEVVHAACDLSASDAKRSDVDGDGRSDITVSDDCSAYDLNFDGKVDSWVYVDSAGRVRRREMDFDRDGRVDEIQVYENGALVQKHRSTARLNRLDTWHFYSQGRLLRTERDSNSDGVVDQWWEYPSPGCPVIKSDINRDGRPDDDSAVDYCKETGYVPPERDVAASTKGPTFERPGATPQSVEGKSDDTPTAPPPDAGETGEKP
jgi:hypothetical protein